MFPRRKEGCSETWQLMTEKVWPTPEVRPLVLVGPLHGKMSPAIGYGGLLKDAQTWLCGYIHNASMLSCFKSCLKIHLFHEVFGNVDVVNQPHIFPHVPLPVPQFSALSLCQISGTRPAITNTQYQLNSTGPTEEVRLKFSSNASYPLGFLTWFSLSLPLSLLPHLWFP